MSVITSKLTRDQEKKICSMFGHAKLSLIFKASVHGYHSNNFHYKCSQQGPTLTVAYNNSGFIFGAYTSKDYARTGQNIIDEKAFLFSLDGREQNPEPYRVTSTGQYSFIDGATGPHFGSLVFLFNNVATIQSNPGNVFNFDPLKMHGNDLQLTEFEVYRVEECDALLTKPWRNVTWNAETKKGLMETIANWKSGVNSVDQARILLVGQVGAGKSSFFNAVSSVFKGHVTSQANTGTAGTSLTTQFRTYSVRGGPSKKALPIVLCDTMGLEEGLNAGLDIEDFTSILKGHVQDRYQFNPSMPIQEDAPGFRKSFTLKDKIHCVVYVIDTAKVKLLPARMVEKFAAFRRKTNQLGIPQLVLMTKVDEACRLVAEDLTNVYCSRTIEAMMRDVAAQLGVSMSAVIPVKNYSQELELDLHTDILLLNSVVQMLRVAESYFDDLFMDEEEKAD
ncbi:interferon-induced protein 44-like [Sardina pilchardus]|uniref:interferon-induced protein 44-like n=1 Tax=Sardina pilchardus TaxID=27697 RepID=UPI002E10BF2C